jgi:DNA-directed RNA polymerase specialized sigma24 family protein
MAKKICKGSQESEDVAHFAITSFMEHERGQELVDAKRGMQFLSGIIWRSFNSSTSEYHSIYRQKGRMHSLESNELEMPDDDYDLNQDLVVEAIQGILEDMEADRTDLWYRATLLQMYLQNPNYSDLARKTKIPRNSISHAVEEAKTYIKEQLKIQGIHYDF